MTPSRPDPKSGRTLAAELAMGVLDGEARAKAEARAASDPEFAAEAAAWSARLHPLAEDVAPVTAPDTLWSRIEAALPAAETPVQAAASTPTGAPVVELAPRAQLRRWRVLAGGLGAALAACFAALAIMVGRQAMDGPMLTARLTPPASASLLGPSEALYTATIDRGRRAAVITPVNPGPSDPRVRELWVIPAGGKAISAGLLDREKAVPLRLSPELARLAAQGATLAVTLEPPGGAPGGVATGPVIAQGVLARL